MNIADVPDLPLQATEIELKSVLQALPKFPCVPDPNETVLQDVLAKSASFNQALENLGHAWCSDFFAIGALIKSKFKHERYSVGPAEIGPRVNEHGDPRKGVCGDLEVQGDLSVYGPLVVTGDLTVHGLLTDCGPDSRVAVLGNLYCEHLDTSGTIVVGGSVHVKGAIYGDYNDDILEVLGDIDAGIILSHDHSIEAEGAIRVKHAPKKAGVWGGLIFDLYSNQDHIEEARKLIGNDFFDEDHTVDMSILCTFKA
jgi:hypothetical protein